VRPGRQFDGDPPDAVRAFAQADGFFLPVREVARQLHGHRRGRREGERLGSPVARPGFSILCMISICHICPLVSLVFYLRRV
jgi:hypothetical protein